MRPLKRLVRFSERNPTAIQSVCAQVLLMRPFYPAEYNAYLLEIGYIPEFFENSLTQVRYYVKQSGFPIAESDTKLVFRPYLNLCDLRTHFITSLPQGLNFEDLLTFNG